MYLIETILIFSMVITPFILIASALCWLADNTKIFDKLLKMMEE